MTIASARIVVQATAEDKKAITDKARRLAMPVSELMRRGAFAYAPDESDEELAALADVAKAAADRAGAAIDDALDFIAASNRRIEAMEAKARRTASQTAPVGAAESRTHATRKAAARRVAARKRTSGKSLMGKDRR